RALDRIEGKVPNAIRDDIEFLRANVYLSMQRPGDAVDILEKLDAGGDLEPFVSYNLGIALLRDGREEAAVQQLDKAGQGDGDDPAVTAIRDKSNLVLGTILLESGRYQEAKRYLDRVHLEGPFATQALLSSGWADVNAGNYERAIVPWRILAERNVTDSAAQEGMLALPFAYGKLDIHGRAAVYYGRALDTFGQELGKLDASIESIRKGNFLRALIREEIRQNKDWVIRLRSLPETPETYYLMELLASHDFQTGLQNYLDLADLRRKLHAWKTGLDAFEDMAALREAHYEPLLPGIDGDFRKLDSRMRLRLEQQRLLERRMQGMLTAPRPEFLATAGESALLARIDDLRRRVEEANRPDSEELMRRIDRLHGRLIWTLRTEYHERLTKLDASLRELRDATDVLERQYRQFVRVRQAATHSYAGYEKPIHRLRARVVSALAEVDRLMARQGHVIEVVAIDELESRRERLYAYQDKARYALADSYDRATQAQARRVESR
ncbi:MAG TPA: tetratricopeptide repeat protein, partial [Woeseiaceae bacterium]|nr:tetratricopeptide repeat protein [Woeseiaceae bacterium]